MRVDPGSFEDLYRSADDPWAFTTSPYELDKYSTTVANLASPQYSRCFEPACSIGVLTERLALRAAEIVACDGSPTAITRARARLTDTDNVELIAAAIPEWWPSGTFDLIVLSELGYYWDVSGWRDIIRRCIDSLRASGEIIAVHWLGSSPDHVLDGATVHHEMYAQLGPSDLHLERTVDSDSAVLTAFVLDRWTRVRHER